MRILLLISLCQSSIKFAVSPWSFEPDLCCGWEPVTDDGSASIVTVATPVHVVVRTRERAEGLSQLRRDALAVSDPVSARYGEHLLQARIDALTLPTPADQNAVRKWLSSETNCSVVRTLKPGRVVEIRCTKPAAERLFRTSFHQIHNPLLTDQAALHRASDYWVPDAVGAAFGLHDLPLPPQLISSTRAFTPTANDSKVTPSAILDAYNCTGQVRVSPSSPNTQAVVSFGDQRINSSDLRSFLAHFGSDPLNAKLEFVGDTNVGKGGMEASLDVQYMVGLSAPSGGVKTRSWHLNGEDNGAKKVGFCQQLHEWTQKLLADDASTPLVNSASYGWQGNLTSIGCPLSAQTAIDDDFAKLAAKGITLIIASGDYGSGSGGGNGGKCIPTLQKIGRSSFDSLGNTALLGTVLSDFTQCHKSTGKCVLNLCTCHEIAAGRPYTFTATTELQQDSDASSGASNVSLPLHVGGSMVYPAESFSAACGPGSWRTGDILSSGGEKITDIAVIGSNGPQFCCTSFVTVKNWRQDAAAWTFIPPDHGGAEPDGLCRYFVRTGIGCLKMHVCALLMPIFV